MNTQIKHSPKKITLAENRKALFDYEIVETFEAGIVLMGAEVKSIRKKSVNLKGNHVVVASGRPVIVGMHVSPYFEARLTARILDPLRERPLLLKQKDIVRLSAKMKEKGMTLIVTEIYQKGNLMKAEVSLARGRKGFDKKQLLKERDMQREAQRSISERI